MTLTEDMTVYLAQKGLGTKGTNLFEGEFPATGADDAMYVREYGGPPPGHSKSGTHERRPRFSLVARSKSARAARMRVEDGVRHLSAISGLVNGTVYAGVRALREPAPIGRDDSGRERVICDFEAIK
jgi:hypothetical protein